MSDLWADLEAESQKPGPTMTITKAQYAALTAAMDQRRHYHTFTEPPYGPFADPVPTTRVCFAKDCEGSCAEHVHVAGRPPNYIDRCEDCGHDLRALCHRRGRP